MIIDPFPASEMRRTRTCEELQVGVRQRLLDLQAVLLAVQLLSIARAPLLSLLQLRAEALRLQLAALLSQVPGL